jgi:hypothetical protein
MSDESTENKDISEINKKSSETNSAVFTKEYVEDLRNESKTLRQKLADAEKIKKDEISAKDKEHESIIGKRIEEVSSLYKKELMLTKVQVEAVKSGIIDLDGVKLADFSKISFDENDNLVGTAELIEELKKNKPYLFKKTDKTTYEKDLPAKGVDTKVDVRNMSKDEFSKFKATMLKQK